MLMKDPLTFISSRLIAIKHFENKSSLVICSFVILLSAFATGLKFIVGKLQFFSLYICSARVSCFVFGCLSGREETRHRARYILKISS